MNKIFFIVLMLIGIVSFGQGYEGKVSIGYMYGIDNMDDDHPFNAFGGFSNAHNRLLIDVLNGYRFHPQIFTGIGTGIRKYFVSERNWRDFNMMLIPIYGNVKSNLTKTKVSPFVELSVGYSFVVYDEVSNDFGYYLDTEGGFMYCFSVGIDVKLKNSKSLSIGIGHDVQDVTETFRTPVGGEWYDIEYKDGFSGIGLLIGYIF